MTNTLRSFILYSWWLGNVNNQRTPVYSSLLFSSPSSCTIYSSQSFQLRLAPSQLLLLTLIPPKDHPTPSLTPAAAVAAVALRQRPAHHVHSPPSHPCRLRRRRSGAQTARQTVQTGPGHANAVIKTINVKLRRNIGAMITVFIVSRW